MLDTGISTEVFSPRFVVQNEKFHDIRILLIQEFYEFIEYCCIFIDYYFIFMRSDVKSPCFESRYFLM